MELQSLGMSLGIRVVEPENEVAVPGNGTKE